MGIQLVSKINLLIPIFHIIMILRTLWINLEDLLKKHRLPISCKVIFDVTSTENLKLWYAAVIDAEQGFDNKGKCQTKNLLA